MPDNDSERTNLIHLQREIWNSIYNLSQTLTEDEWAYETDCPGWSVKDCFSHLIGIEHRLLGRPVGCTDLEESAHVKNELGRRNEIDILLRRKVSSESLVEEFNEVNSERLKILLKEVDFSKSVETPIGPGSLKDLVTMRVFDCWVHEQDIRRAVGRRGNISSQVALHCLLYVKNFMPYVVGKKAKIPEGKTILFKISDQTIESFSIGVREGRAIFLEGDSRPDTSIETSVDVFLMLACGRKKINHILENDNISIHGDKDLGIRVASEIPIIS